MLKMKLSYSDRSDRVQFVTKTKQNNDVTDCIGVVYVETETKLSDLSNQVQYVTKTRHDNDMVDCIGAVFIENNTELSWFIRPGAFMTKLDRITIWSIL